MPTVGVADRLLIFRGWGCGGVIISSANEAKLMLAVGGGTDLEVLLGHEGRVEINEIERVARELRDGALQWCQDEAILRAGLRGGG